MAKYDEHRAFLAKILDTMTKNRDELEARTEDLNDQITFIQDAIQALNVFEHIPSNKE